MFKEEVLKEGVVVHCETEEQAKKLLSWADSRGFGWRDATSYMDEIYWRVYNEDTCYCLSDGSYGGFAFYSEHPQYEVIPFKEALAEPVKTIRLSNLDKISHRTHYVKCVLNFDEETSIRYHYTFEDKPHLEGVFVIKNHKTGFLEKIEPRLAKFFVRNYSEDDWVEVQGRKLAGKYEKVVRSLGSLLVV